MKRLNLVVLVMAPWCIGVALADPPTGIQLTPVDGSPSPGGTLRNVTYDTYMAYDEDGWPIGKVGRCATDFQFSALEPNAWYNLRGIIVTKRGYRYDYTFTSRDFLWQYPDDPDHFEWWGCTFYTDADGNAQGFAFTDDLPPRTKFGYFELWTGNYCDNNFDRSKMVLVLSSE